MSAISDFKKRFSRDSSLHLCFKLFISLTRNFFSVILFHLDWFNFEVMLLCVAAHSNCLHGYFELCNI